MGNNKGPKKAKKRGVWDIVSKDTGEIIGSFSGNEDIASLQITNDQYLFPVKRATNGRSKIYDVKKPFSKKPELINKGLPELSRTEKRVKARDKTMPITLQLEAIIDMARTLQNLGINVGTKMHDMVSIDDQIRVDNP